VWTVALQDVVFEQPARTPSESELEEMDLKYYSPAMHRAALTLPRFVKKVTVCILQLSVHAYVIITSLSLYLL